MVIRVVTDSDTRVSPGGIGWVVRLPPQAAGCAAAAPPNVSDNVRQWMDRTPLTPAVMRQRRTTRSRQLKDLRAMSLPAYYAARTPKRRR